LATVWATNLNLDINHLLYLKALFLSKYGKNGNLYTKIKKQVSILKPISLENAIYNIIEFKT